MLEIEEWRPIADWPEYAVSNFGRVKRVQHGPGPAVAGKILKPRFSTGVDYPSVALCRKGEQHNRFIHLLVADAFLGPCPEGHEVNHENGNKADPRASNLEYLTHSQNILHAYATGLKSSAGEKNSRAILTETDVRSIRVEYTGAYGQCAKLARRYNVSHAAMQDVVHRRNWAHI